MGRQGRPARAGFTIIEVTVVLILVAAIAGVVLPTLSWRTEDRLFDEACRRLETAAAWCRVEAGTQGRPLQLVALRRDDRWVLVLRDWSPESDDAARAEDDAEPFLAEPELGRRETVLSELPPRIEIEEAPSDEDNGSAMLMPSSDALLRGSVNEWVICIFMPDGPGPPGDPVQLTGSGDAKAMLRWQPWSSSLVVGPDDVAETGPDGESAAPIEDAFVPFPMEAGAP